MQKTLELYIGVFFILTSRKSISDCRQLSLDTFCTALSKLSIVKQTISDSYRQQTLQLINCYRDTHYRDASIQFRCIVTPLLYSVGDRTRLVPHLMSVFHFNEHFSIIRIIHFTVFFDKEASLKTSDLVFCILAVLTFTCTPSFLYIYFK